MKLILKLLKKCLKVSCISLIICIILLYIFDYDYILKGVRVVYGTGHTTAYIDDHPHFDNRTIAKGETSIPWALHQQYNTVQPTARLEAIHKQLGTVAYMIIKNDSIWYENYADGYTAQSKTNSFSMAKSIVTMLLGKAIMQGHIKNLDQAVGDFIPEFSEGLAAKTTVGDLSAMASGLNWDEQYYSPFSITAKAYYDSNIREVITGLEVTETPGQEFKYLSGSTQLLGMVIEKATGTTLSNYLQTQFWQPMGMEEDALWELDSEDSGMEKAYCCISSNARDYAKFGSLFNHKGTFAGKQILTKDFVTKATQPRFKNSPMYGYGFWLSNHLGKKSYVMRGILGQYVIGIPEDNIIIVRLGHKRGDFLNNNNFTHDFYIYIEEAYKMLNNAT